jgi:hypothetical protein
MSLLKQLLQGQETIKKDIATILQKIDALEGTLHVNMAARENHPDVLLPLDHALSLQPDFTSSSHGSAPSGALQCTSHPTSNGSALSGALQHTTHPTSHGSAPKHWLMPIPPAKGEQEFEAEDIDRSALISIEDAKWSYRCMLTDSKMSTVAVKLAREVFFGDSVLERCSPRGGGKAPSLPHRVLNTLKMTLFELFPSYWSIPESFEQKWVLAQDAIAQHCKRLRKKKGVSLLA